VGEFWLARCVLVLCLSCIFPYWRVLYHLLSHRHRLPLIPSVVELPKLYGPQVSGIVPKTFDGYACISDNLKSLSGVL
jgi:hypothetical protein